MNPNQNATAPHTPAQLAYTPRQAAQMLGLSEPAIRARLFRGQLPASPMGTTGTHPARGPDEGAGSVRRLPEGPSAPQDESAHDG